MRLADRVQLVDPDWPSISRRFGAGIQAEIRSSETEKRRCALALVRLYNKGDRQSRNERHTFVLVHGGWCGGWIWRYVAPALRERGHVVTTPTLTGLGERRHSENRLTR